MSTAAVKSVKSPLPDVKRDNRAACVACHQTKRIQARGLCSACYMKQRRRGITAIDTITELADRMERKAEEQRNFAQEARRILTEGLPEAAMLMRRAAHKAAERGDHRPAEAILAGTPVKLEDGSERALVGQAQKAVNAAPPIQIAIGFAGQLGGSRQATQLPVATDVDAEVVTPVPASAPN
jgi:hypothetical protein